VRWLVGDPADRDVVLAGPTLLDSTGNDQDAGTILRTTNGTNWTTVRTTNYVTRLQMCPSDHTLVYASTGSGLERSNDGGVTWSLVHASFHAIDAAIAPTDCARVYLTTWGDAMRLSTDGGATFGGPLTNGIPFGNAFPRKVSVDPTDASRLLGTTPGGLLLTTNAGGSWTITGGAMGLAIRSLATSPTAPGRMWMGTWGAQSFVRDGANPWGRVPFRWDYVFVVTPDPVVPNRTFFGTWSPIFVTNDGMTFTQTSVMDNPMAFAFDPTNTNVVYAATELGGVYKSSDGGGSWVASNNGMSPFMDGNGTFIDVRSIHVDATNALRVFTGAYEHGLWISGDGAASWTQSSYLSSQSWTCFAQLAGNGASVIYAGVGGHGLLRSVDGGVTWSDSSVGLPSEDVQAIVADAVTRNLFVTMKSGVFRSRDGGNTWAGVDTACLKGAGAAAMVKTASGRKVAVATSDGVFVHGL
jgi:photosystem II stability/assembly factor-like uncharacterized protein